MVLKRLYSCVNNIFLTHIGKFKITGTSPLMRFFGPGKNRVKGKPRYRRSILVLKPQNGEFETSKSTFSLVFTILVMLV